MLSFSSVTVSIIVLQKFVQVKAGIDDSAACSHFSFQVLDFLHLSFWLGRRLPVVSSSSQSATSSPASTNSWVPLLKTVEKETDCPLGKDQTHQHLQQRERTVIPNTENIEPINTVTNESKAALHCRRKMKVKAVSILKSRLPSAVSNSQYWFNLKSWWGSNMLLINSLHTFD